MVPYTKPAKSPADLVQQLKQRGLAITDEARAERYIDNIGYYRLSAYMYPFLAEPKTAHQYKSGITFDRVLRLYRFDKKLRVLLFNENMPTRPRTLSYTSRTRIQILIRQHGYCRRSSPSETQHGYSGISPRRTRKLWLRSSSFTHPCLNRG